MPTHKTWGALAALVSSSIALAALLAACGGGTSSQAPPAEDAALRAAQPGELAAYFRARIVQSATPSGSLPIPGAGVSPSGVVGDTASESTTIQEAGVDEENLLKTDGSAIYALYPGTISAEGPVGPRLEARRIQSDGSLGAPSTMAAGAAGTVVSGLHVAPAAQRGVVVAQKGARVSLDVMNLPADSAPTRANTILIDGWLVGTRRIGNVLYVASTWRPDLSAYHLTAGTPPAQVDAALAQLTAAALLPTIAIDQGAAQPLVVENQCQLQPGNASRSMQLTTVTAIDLSTPALQRQSRCFIGDGSSLYMSTTAVYVATSRNYALGSDVGLTVLPAETSTDIHKFALEGLNISYRGSGTVDGHLGWDREKMPYRMSEYQGDLRVLTFTGQSGWIGRPMPMPQPVSTAVSIVPVVPATPPSPATLTVLREQTGTARLAKVSTLPNRERPAALGHEGEQVYAVRFAGPLAYLVTFRMTDPLYVLDLSNPADPKTASELQMPGFSDYLFPLANGKLLGVGKDATAAGLVQGLKIALFDVANPAQPQLLSTQTLGGRGTQSALDFSRQGISILQQGAQARIALPVSVTGSAGTVLRHGLARYSVDTAAGTLQEQPMVVAMDFGGTVPSHSPFTRFHLWMDRVIQSVSATYYMTGGEVKHTPQP